MWRNFTHFRLTRSAFGASLLVASLAILEGCGAQGTPQNQSIGSSENDCDFHSPVTPEPHDINKFVNGAGIAVGINDTILSTTSLIPGCIFGAQYHSNEYELGEDRIIIQAVQDPSLPKTPCSPAQNGSTGNFGVYIVDNYLKPMAVPFKDPGHTDYHPPAGDAGSSTLPMLDIALLTSNSPTFIPPQENPSITGFPNPSGPAESIKDLEIALKLMNHAGEQFNPNENFQYAGNRTAQAILCSAKRKLEGYLTHLKR